MKKILAILSLSILSNGALANNPEFKAEDFTFAAPVVQDKTNLSAAVAGQIVFENSSGYFFGLPVGADPTSPTDSWLQLNTVSVGGIPANNVWIGPTSGGNAQPTWRPLSAADITFPTAYLSFSSGLTTIADGLTRYLGLGVVSAAITDVTMVVPYSGQITNLAASTSGITTGGTRAYTLYKNGSATSLTCSTTGGISTCNDNSHSVSVSVNDTIAIQIVTSGGSDTMIHKASLTVKP